MAYFFQRHGVYRIGYIHNKMRYFIIITVIVIVITIIIIVIIITRVCIYLMMVCQNSEYNRPRPAERVVQISTA